MNRIHPLCRAALAALLFVPTLALADEPVADPTKAEVPLPARAGWHGSLLLDNDVGVWTVGTAQIFPRYGCPEVFGLDDKGRCTVLVSYSGKWTPLQTVHDGKWLGALQLLDLDPHIPGPEIYTGGQKGNLFQIRAHHEGDFDTRIVARFPGEEIHTLVGGDLLPERPGQELLGFSRLGLVWDLRPAGRPGAEPFRTPVIARLDGRVRQALLLPAREGETPWVAATCRFGKVLLLRMRGDGLQVETVAEEPMGFGRLAVKRTAPGEPFVLYASRDDGVILRLEGSPGVDHFAREVIYAGPQGPRGVAAGRFHQDPEVETIAVFGYSKKVQLLSRQKDGPWTVETLFEDVDKGHWLSAAEIDGRNGTDELIGSGYGKRIFALSRPPGYGLGTAPTDPDPAPRTGPEDAAERPIRLAVRVSDPSPEKVNPLVYRGGFVTKTLVYETLVRRDESGRIAPGLAESWRFEQSGRSLVLTLRAGARFHDGTPVDAQAVVDHLERWVRLPEHAWLHSSDRIREIRARNDREVEITTDEPCAVLPDLVAVNPCAIRAPNAVDAEGNFVRPLGSGPFVFSGTDRSGTRYRYRRADDALFLELVPMARSGNDPLAALLAGHVDVLADGWYDAVPRKRLAELAADPRLRIESACGSSVIYLSFRFESGRTAERAVRRAIAAAVDRPALIAGAEAGRADPCTGFAAPTVAIWPQPTGSTGLTPGTAADLHEPLVLLLGDDERQQRLGPVLAEQLRRRGIPVETLTARGDELDARIEAGSFDLRLESTWGVPYDPYITLVNRCLPPSRSKSAARRRDLGIDPRLAALVRQASRTADPERLPPLYARIQELIDAETLLVPLFVPHRIAALRAGIEGLALDHDLYHLDLSRLRLRS